MKILVLGGTGAIGVPVVQNLSKTNEVYVTSRSNHSDYANVHYLQGDAHSITFLKSVILKEFDVIIDFLKYPTRDFYKRVDLLLSASNHYVFLSSGRVYASNDYLLSEESPRLLDVIIDDDYLSTDEYALNKARCEDILRNNKYQNWTIIRPYITYFDQRIQLGVYEKENWLRRALNGHTIVFPEDIADKKTTITYGGDVARRISILSSSEITKGQIYNVTCNQVFSWKEIIKVVSKEIHIITGNDIRIKYIDNSDDLCKVWNKYQIIYDRLYSRRFDNRKQEEICGNSYTDVISGISKCLKNCIKNPIYDDSKIKWAYEGWSDRLTNEITQVELLDEEQKKDYLYNRLG